MGTEYDQTHPEKFCRVFRTHGPAAAAAAEFRPRFVSARGFHFASRIADERKSRAHFSRGPAVDCEISLNPHEPGRSTRVTPWMNWMPPVGRSVPKEPAAKHGRPPRRPRTRPPFASQERVERSKGLLLKFPRTGSCDASVKAATERFGWPSIRWG